jgi:DNA-binding NarL/FixJ family response regulator
MTAATIGDGLLRASEWQPSVILCDVYFDDGGRTGIDAIPDFRTACPRATIVIFTAAFREEDAMRALGLGAAAYLEKGDLRRLKKHLLAARLASRPLSPGSGDH